VSERTRKLLVCGSIGMAGQVTRAVEGLHVPEVLRKAN